MQHTTTMEVTQCNTYTELEVVISAVYLPAVTSSEG